MSKEASWKVVDLKWWNKPVPLWRPAQGGKDAQRIGWVWNQKAYVVKNIHSGWVAFVDDQTQENLAVEDIWRCPYCDASIWGHNRDRIIKHVKESK